MPWSGLVLTLQDAASLAALRVELASDPDITLGAAQGVRLPLVVETRTLAAGQARYEELEGRAGVLQVALIHLDQSDLDLLLEETPNHGS